MSLHTIPKQDIAIIGMACRFPGAKDYHAFWNNLINGVNSIREIPPERWDISTYYSPNKNKPNRSISKWCGLLDNIDQFDHRFFSISPREAKSMDPQQRLLLEETWHCIEDSGISIKVLQEKKTSIYVGVMAGDYHSKGSEMITDSYTALGNYESILANRISYTFGFHGASLTINAACAASMAALHNAQTILLSGESDYAIAAGVNLNIHPWKYISFSKSRMLSPYGQCKTFDKDANGYVPGDGVGVLLLQPLKDALRDKCHIYGIIKGSAVNHVGHTASITAPSVDGQRGVIIDACKKAGVSPETVTYVEAHGTGTSLGDPIEVEALTRAFREYTDQKQFCRIGSVKTNIGHLEGAAGIAGIIKVLLMMNCKKIPPTLNIKTLNPVINFEDSPFIVATELEEWPERGKNQPLRAGISSFGFGGVNTHVILESMENHIPSILEESNEKQPFIVTAKSPAAFKNTLQGWREFVNGDLYPTYRLIDICGTNITAREAFSHGFGCYVSSKDELKEILSKEIEPASRQSEHPWSLIIGECNWEGFVDPVKHMLSEHPLLKDKLDLLLNEFSKIIRIKKSTIHEEFYQPVWIETKKPLYSFIVNHAILLTTMEFGFKPSLLTGEGSGIWQALTLSGIIKKEELFKILKGRKKPEEAALSRPALPFYDPVTKQTIMTYRIDARYLSTLIDDMAINEEESRFFIEKSRMMHTNQYTFKKYLEQWGSRLKERSNKELSVMLYDDQLLFNTDDLNQKERLLFVIILAASHHYVEQKWNLSKVKEISDKKFNELLDLVLDGVMTQEALIDLFTQKEPDLYAIAALLNERQGRLNKEKAYPFLKRHSQAIPALPDHDDWFTKVMETSMPELDGHNRLKLGGTLKENNDRVIHIASKELNNNNNSILRNILLRLWLKGVDIKWNLFYRNGSFHKIPLPVYGFDRMSFWLNGKGENKMKDRKGYSELIKSHDNPNTFTRELDPEKDAIITDTIVEGFFITPSPLRIEMALQAVREVVSSQINTLSALRFPDPAIITQKTEIEVEVWKNTKQFHLKKAGQIICSGRFDITEKESSEPLLLDDLYKGKVTNHEDIYSWFHDFGYHYGPGMRLIDKIWETKEAFLVKIIPKPTLEGDITKFDPFILDCVFQSVFYAGHTIGDLFQNKYLYLPLTIGSLHLAGPLTDECFALISREKLRILDNKDMILDMDVYDNNGRNKILEIREIHFRRVPRNFIDQYLEKQHKELENPIGKRDESLVIKEILSVIESYIEENASDMKQVEEGMSLLEDYGRLRLFHTLFFKNGDVVTKKDIKFIGKYKKLSRALYEMLAVSKIIEMEGENVVISKEFIREDDVIDKIKGLKSSLDEKYIAIKPFQNLLESAVIQYPDVISGKKSHMEALFLGGQTELFNHVYKGNRLSDYYNHQVRLSLETIIKEKLKGDTNKKIKILELGAGIGGTTEIVLDGIKSYGDRIEYVYTDISLGFINLGRKSYGDKYPFLRFQLFDLEKKGIEQGLEESEFDIILATNTLHATKNLEQTLLNIKELLKNSEGILILNEITRAQDFWTIVTGLINGWWVYQDNDLRIKNSPLADFETWKRLLHQAGFQDVRGFDLKRKRDYEQTVMIAVHKADQAKKGDHITSKMIEKTDHTVLSDISKETSRYLKEIFAKQLHCKIEEIDDKGSFSDDYGVDSFVNLEIIEILKKEFGETIPNTLLFECTTMKKLTEYVINNFERELKLKLGDFETEMPVEKENQREESAEDQGAIYPVGHKSIHDDFAPSQREEEDIAIIGLNGRFPLSEDVNALWDHLKNGESCIREVPESRWDYRKYYDQTGKRPDKSYTKYGGFLDDYDKFDAPFFHISPRQAELMDPQQRIVLETAWAVIEDAGYTRAALPRNTGVFIGVTTNTYGLCGLEASLKSEETYCPDTDNYDVPNRVSYFFDLHGPSVAIDTACSSSLSAIHMAVKSLKNKESDVAIAGGVSLTLHPNRVIQFCQKSMLLPGKECHPFGQGEGGFVDSEGVALILLKPLLKAIKDRDHIYGVIKGTAMNSGGKTSGYTVPDPARQASLVINALEDAKTDPVTISYIETHGTGTTLGDPIEVEGLTKAFRKYTDKTQYCPIGSIKSNIGHLIAAAGVAGVTKVLLQMKHKTLVPSIHSSSPNSHIDFSKTPFFVQQNLTEWKKPEIEGRPYPRRAGISSFGAGGANAHVIIEEYERDHSDLKVSSIKPSIIVLSAKTKERLHEYIRKFSDCLELDMAGDVTLEDISYTLQTGREAMEERLALIVDSKNQLITKLTDYRKSKSGIEDLYSGNVKTDKGTSDLLLNGNAGEAFLEIIIKERNLSKLARLWVTGIEIDWNLLYGEVKPRRVSLPVYPFEKKRYWFDDYIKLKEAEREGKNTSSISDKEESKDIPEQSIEMLQKPESYRGDEVIVRIIDNHTGLVIMQDREGSNTFTENLVYGLQQAFQELNRNRDIKVIVLTGYDKVFAMGGSQKDLTRLSRQEINFTSFKFFYRGLLETRAPVIVAMQGHASGGGLVFGLFGDIIIMAREGVYSANFMGYGFTPGLGTTYILEQRFGKSLATEMMFTSKSYRGADLERRGGSVLFCNHEAVLNEALNMAKNMVEKPGKSLEVLKKELSGRILEQLPSIIEKEVVMHEHTFSLPEVRKNIESHFQKVSVIGKAGNVNNKLKLKDREDIYLPAKTSEINNRKMRLKPLQERSTTNNSLENSPETAGDNTNPETMEPTPFRPVKKSALHIRSEVINIVSSRLHINREEIDPDMPFLELGVDSISAVEITQDINEKFHITNLRVTDIYNHPDISSLTNYLMTLDIVDYDVKVESHRMHIDEKEIRETPEPLLFSSMNTTGNKPLTIEPYSNLYFPKKETDIAVIGISARFPGADNVEQFWRNICDKRDEIREVPKDRWDIGPYFHPDPDRPDKSYSKWGGFLKDVDKFDPLFFGISPKEAEVMDPQQRILLEEAYHTIEDAGYDPVYLSKGKCGVFIGAAMGDYLGRNKPDNNVYTGFAFTGLNLSVLAGRISYFLDLKGPAISIDTACSSSLAAISMACRSIVSNECDTALAGGISLMHSPLLHIQASQAGMLSKDGRCKPFSNSADGIVLSEGVGIILLKPYKKAIEDNDHIYGVIKGWGTNQDGHTNGITAPNPEAQTELERHIYKEFNINPEHIRYAEAHGTGTKLGDPIEIRGLSDAFREYTKKKGYCAIGSVKSNIGHTTMAAGVAGLIKALLSLKYRVIPPTIHCDVENEHIDFKESPFYLNREIGKWEKTDNTAGLACVSSFGFSGTNAHVVLGEHLPDHSIKSRDQISTPIIILLSARDKEQLRRVGENLLSHITLHKPDISDMAYTLQVGRKAMAHRIAFKAKEMDDVKEKISEYINGQGEAAGLWEGEVKLNHDRVTILEEDEDTQEMIRKWISKGKVSKLAELWVKGLDIDWNLLYGEDKPRRISLPAYPFAKQRYWIPDTGRKIATIQSGITPIHPLLHENTSTLQRQQFTSTFTGEEFFLRDHQILNEKVLPGVAYLEIALAAAIKAVETDDWKTCKLKDIIWAAPVKVNTGPREVKINLFPETDSIAYEVRTEDPEADPDESLIVHNQGKIIIDPVRSIPTVLDIQAIKERCTEQLTPQICYRTFQSFGLLYGPAFQGISELYYNNQEVLAKIEIPGLDESNSGFYLHPGVLDSALQASLCLIFETLKGTSTPYLPFELKELEIFEIPLPDTIYVHVTFSNNSLLDEMVKYDISLLNHQGETVVSLKELAIRQMRVGRAGRREQAKHLNEYGLLYATPEWKNQSITGTTDSASQDKELHMILIGQSEEMAHTLKERLAPKTELSLTTINTPEEILEAFKVSFLHIKGIIESKPSTLQTIIVIPSTDIPEYCYAPLTGLLKTATLEHTKLQGKVIQLPELTPEQTAAIIEQETQTTEDMEVRYLKEDTQRQVKRLIEIEHPPAGPISPLKSGGVYWITGGLGGLGRLFAGEFAKAENSTIILSNRRELDEMSQRELEELQREAKDHQSTVEYVRCDVTDRDSVIGTVRTIMENHHKLTGIIHSAGVIKDNYIHNKSETEIDEVMAPKIYGAWNITQAVSGEEVDFMVFFSSIAGIKGNPGQADYAGANAFLDAFADTESRVNRKKMVSINWPLWKEGGMEVESRTEEMLKQTLGIVPLTTEKGYAGFQSALNGPYNRIVVAEGQSRLLRKKLLNQPLFKSDRNNGNAPEEVLKERLRPELTGIVSNLIMIKPEELDITDDISDYGFDSILITEFINRIKKIFDISLMPTIFFEYNTLEGLINYLIKEHGAALQDKYGINRDKEDTEAHKIDMTPDDHMPNNAINQIISRGQRFMAPLQMERPNRKEPIAVIGMAGILPEAENLDQFWENLIQGKECITEIPKDRWDWKACYGDPNREEGKTNVKWGGFIKDIDKFDPAFFNISPREAELMDPQQRLFLQCVWHAIEHAGYNPMSLRGTQTGLFVGVEGQDYHDLITKNRIKTEAYTATGVVPSMAANRISFLLGFHGPSEPVSTACSSSLVAIHRAVRAIHTGECAQAIAGGVNAILSPEFHISFSKAGMLSEDGRCKTFSDKADGYVRGEGVGAILLKPLNQAIQDGDRIYAVIRGTRTNHGGHVNSLTAPNPNAQAELIKAAYEEANISPDTITYIETHGTGTELGDPVEINGLKTAFTSLYEKYHLKEPEKPHCGIGSVKSNIGHLETAAGIAGLLKVILAIRHKAIPPTLHCDTINPYINLHNTPFYIAMEKGEWKSLTDNYGNPVPRRAGVSSFGFGGAYAHVVVEEFLETEKPENQGVSQKVVIPLSAKNRIQLKSYAQLLTDDLNQKKDKDLAHIAYTLQTGREAMNSRIAFLVKDVGELKEKLDQYLKGEEEIEYFRKGEVKINHDGVATLTMDEDAREMIHKWIAKDKIGKLADFWVKGLNIDWNLLYGEVKPQRIALPVYPFEKKRYWFDSYRKSQKAKKEEKNVSSITDQEESKNVRERSTELIAKPEDYRGDEVLVRIINNHIGVVVMQDREGTNTFTENLVYGLQQAFQELKGNKDIKVIVLTGYDKVFAMGGDQKELTKLSRREIEFTSFAFFYKGLLELKVPVIVAMQGHASGGGLVFGLFGDMIIMAREGVYSANFMSYGFTPGLGATYILEQRFGKSLATEMMFTSRSYRGEELERRGGTVLFCNQEMVLNEALNVAKELIEKPGKSLEVLKKELSGRILEQLQSVIEKEAAMHAETFSLPEVKRNIESHFQKVSAMGKGESGNGKKPLKLKDPKDICLPEESKDSNNKKMRLKPLQDMAATDNAFNIDDTSVTGNNPLAMEPALKPVKRPAMDIETEVINILSDLLHIDRDDIDRDMPFLELGVDSISAVEIIQKINERFHIISLKVTDIYDYPDVSSLIRHIESLDIAAFNPESGMKNPDIMIDRPFEKHESSNGDEIDNLLKSCKSMKVSPKEAAKLFVKGDISENI